MRVYSLGVLLLVLPNGASSAKERYQGDECHFLVLTRFEVFSLFAALIAAALNWGLDLVALSIWVV